MRPAFSGTSQGAGTRALWRWGRRSSFVSLCAASFLGVILLGSAQESLSAPPQKAADSAASSQWPFGFLSGSGPTALLTSLAAPPTSDSGAPLAGRNDENRDPELGKGDVLQPEESDNEGSAASPNRPPGPQQQELGEKGNAASRETAELSHSVTDSSSLFAVNARDAQSTLLSLWRKKKNEEAPLPSVASPISQAPAALQSALPFAAWFGTNGDEDLHAGRSPSQANLVHSGNKAPSPATGEAAATASADRQSASWLPSFLSKKAQTDVGMQAFDSLLNSWFHSLRRLLGIPDGGDAALAAANAWESFQGDKSFWRELSGDTRNASPLALARAAAWWFSQREREVENMARVAAGEGTQTVEHAAGVAAASAHAFWHRSGGAQASQETRAALEASAAWFRQQRNKLEQLDADGAAAWWESLTRSPDNLPSSAKQQSAALGAAANVSSGVQQWFRGDEAQRVEGRKATGSMAFLTSESLGLGGPKMDKSRQSAWLSLWKGNEASNSPGDFAAAQVVSPEAAAAAAAAAASWLDWSRAREEETPSPPAPALSWFWSKQEQAVQEAVKNGALWLQKISEAPGAREVKDRAPAVRHSASSWVHSWLSSAGKGAKEVQEAEEQEGGEPDRESEGGVSFFSRWFGQKSSPIQEEKTDGAAQDSLQRPEAASRWWLGQASSESNGDKKEEALGSEAHEQLADNLLASTPNDNEHSAGGDKAKEPEDTSGWFFQQKTFSDPNYPNKAGQAHQIAEDVPQVKKGSAWLTDGEFVDGKAESSKETGRVDTSLLAQASQVLAQKAPQVSGWIFGGASEPEANGEDPAAHLVPGLKQGNSWWEWETSQTTTTTKTPAYTRDVKLDCNPVPPFRACVEKCQRDNRSREKDKAGPSAPQALGSYEYGSLRSCYLTCKQKWIDTDLPGCLRADGVRVAGVPPVEAFRSTTSTTTSSTTTTTTHPPRTEPKAKEPTAEAAKSFWGGLSDKPSASEDLGDAPQEGIKSFFSIFQRATSTSTTTAPPEAPEGFSLTKLLGFHRPETDTVSPGTASSSSFPFSLRGASTLWSARDDSKSEVGGGLLGSLFRRNVSEVPKLAAANGVEEANVASAFRSTEDEEHASAGGSWWSSLSRSNDAEGRKDEKEAASGVARVPGKRSVEEAADAAAASAKDLVDEADDAVESVLSTWWPVFLLVVGMGLLGLCVLGRRLGQWEGMAGVGDIERGEYASAPVFREGDSGKHEDNPRRSVDVLANDDNRRPLIEQSA
ncbi:putative transmembrane protein [Toxoplasma gondii RUB]|uniref:Putative transmembrane protein n=1 Tax=Toxoplasma gondii RUB TaxID=935652 RepID=A0A086M7C1_TOXGO|nr:putative transmembrane protein [Toxoplasma gondii RUB]